MNGLRSHRISLQTQQPLCCPLEKQPQVIKLWVWKQQKRYFTRRQSILSRPQYSPSRNWFLNPFLYLWDQLSLTRDLRSRWFSPLLCQKNIAYRLQFKRSTIIIICRDNMHIRALTKCTANFTLNLTCPNHNSSVITRPEASLNILAWLRRWANQHTTWMSALNTAVRSTSVASSSSRWPLPWPTLWQRGASLRPLCPSLLTTIGETWFGDRSSDFSGGFLRKMRSRSTPTNASEVRYSRNRACSFARLSNCQM